MKISKSQVIKHLAIISLVAAPSIASAKPYFEFLFGNAYTFPTEVLIEQEGEEDLRFTTGFETRGLEIPVYYSLRGGWQVGDCGYEVEMIHHKLHGTDLPDEVQHYEISHGLNFILFNRACENSRLNLPILGLNNVAWRTGIGTAAANPHTVVRGQKWFENGGFTFPVLNESGYHFTGPFVQLGIQNQFNSGIVIETKWVGGYINLPVQDGHTEMLHNSAHFLIGYSFK